jgi:hypothetical protein
MLSEKISIWSNKKMCGESRSTECGPVWFALLFYIMLFLLYKLKQIYIIISNIYIFLSHQFIL